VVTVVIVVGGAIFAGRDRILERWYVHRLDSSDLEVRKHAIEKLGEIGSEKAVPRLIEIARTDDDLGPRAVAALVRGREKAPPELLSLLEGKPEDYLRRSVAAIERSRATPAATSALLTIALHGPQYYEGNAEWTDTVPELMLALESGKAQVVQRAIELLPGKGGDLRSVPALFDLLESEEWSVPAAAALARAGPAVLPFLIEALGGGGSLERRRGAILALQDMRTAASPAIPALLKALEDPDCAIRKNAVDALGALGLDSRAISALVQALRDPDFGSQGCEKFCDIRCHAARVRGM